MTDLDYRLENAGANGLALLGVVWLVVLLSCVNVANLLLVEAEARRREVAVRLAMGAARWRLVRMLMVESLLLGLLGAAAGLFFAWWLVELLPAMLVQAPGKRVFELFRLDGRAFAFTFAMAFVTGMLLGLAPALQATRPDLVPALKGESASGCRRYPLSHTLVISQVALSLVLLACSGVLVESFRNTRRLDLGFGRKPVLAVWLASTQNATPRLYREAVARIRGLPGVRCAGVATRAPLSLSGQLMSLNVTIPGHPDFAGRPPVEIKFNRIDEQYLATMGTSLVRGRTFDSRDTESSQPVALINQHMASRYWPNADPIGKWVRTSDTDRQVVGIVPHSTVNSVGEAPEHYLYVPFWQSFTHEMTVLVETAGDPAALAPSSIRSELRRLDRSLDPTFMNSMEDLIRYSARTYQMTAELVGAWESLGFCSRRLGSMASCRTPSRGARARSAFASR